MTRKDYVNLASALQWARPSKTAKPRGYSDRMEAWRNAVDAIASELQTDNPRFDRERFLTACGLED